MGDKQPPSKIGRPLRISGEKPTKEKIFDEALDLFAEQGYDRTSVRRIAEAVGLTESALDKVISRTYKLLGLMSFLTAGDKEVRSWPVRVGSTAPEAAGVIHTDFQKGFIRAEVIGYQDFLRAGDFKKAKELGLARLEGKEYIVQDGDIIEFRFNV